MMFAFVVYNSVYIPIDIAVFSIDKQMGQCVFDVLVDVLFIVDMLLNLRTTYYDEEGQLVLEASTIYKKYLCSYWFVIDFLAVFPFDIIATGGWDCGVSGQADDAYTSVTKMLKALRLLRLVRFRKELERLSGANALRVFVSLFIFVLVAHWLACIWWAVGVFEFNNDEEVARAAAVPVVCDHSHPCSWLRRIPDGELLSPDSSFEVQYVSSFFWSLTTLMKTPWVGPDTVAEKVIGTFAIFAGAIFYAYFLSTVQGSYASYNKAAALKSDKVANLTAFMDAHSIPSHLQQKLLKHTTTKAAILPISLVNSRVLRQLPSHLRGLVVLELYKDTCGDPSSMFPSITVEAAKSMVARLQTQLAMPEQVLIAKNEVCNQLYFLVRGALRVTADAPLGLSAHSGTASSPALSTSNEPSSSASALPERRSWSRKNLVGMRELEKPGSSVGLIEPVHASCLGLYPVWVIAAKKTLLLSISQSGMVDALDGFSDDVEPLRESLIRQHRVLLDSLKLEPSEDSPLAMSAVAIAAAERREQMMKMGLRLTATDKERVAAIEDITYETMQRLAALQKDMEVLPRILKLIEDASARGMLKTLIGPQGQGKTTHHGRQVVRDASWCSRIMRNHEDCA